MTHTMIRFLHLPHSIGHHRITLPYLISPPPPPPPPPSTAATTTALLQPFCHHHQTLSVVGDYSNSESEKYYPPNLHCDDPEEEPREKGIDWRRW